MKTSLSNNCRNIIAYALAKECNNIMNVCPLNENTLGCPFMWNCKDVTTKDWIMALGSIKVEVSDEWIKKRYH